MKKTGYNVRLKRQRDGAWRPFWYGQFTEDGVHREINLNVQWRGKPPESGKIRDAGSAAFEESRGEAEKTLRDHIQESRRKGRAEHLTERLIESKTGRRVEYARIDELPARWRSLGREEKPCERYLQACDAHFRRFGDFMQGRNSAAVYLYEVTGPDAAAFIADMQAKYARKTTRDAAKLLNKGFAVALPVGAANPFAAFIGRRKGNGTGGTVHRRPFTPPELEAMFVAARDDELMHGPIVAAACSGMRRGDVCRLRWVDVNLDEGLLNVKTSKNETAVEIPIFSPLQAVLEVRAGNGSEFVFPEAARMLKENPDGLTWRFKKIVARALSGDTPPEPLEPPVDAAAIEPEGRAAILAALPEGARRDRILDTFRRYCEGESVRGIVTVTGRCKATVSNDLHAAQDIIGKPFLRFQAPRASVKKAVRAATQTAREQGQRAASVRDWHALRTTWVTLALMAGVPLEVVRRVTGHGTVSVVLENYFRPDREQHRAALAAALPAVLIGDPKPKGND